MPRGRKPEGEIALSSAERQARYRDRLRAARPPTALTSNTPADRRSRARRWRDAVTALLAAQAEYAAWSDALPDSLRDTATDRRSRKSSNSTSMISPQSSRRAAMDATERD